MENLEVTKQPSEKMLPSNQQWVSFSSQDFDISLVSIIIVNYNGCSLLKDCLASILGSAYPFFEIIIVDNGSTDNSVKFVQQFSKCSQVPIKLIINHKNFGFAEANNIGVEHSTGKYVCFLNNDTLVDKNWLKNMLRLLLRDKSIGIVQSLLLTSDRSKIDSAGGSIDVYGIARERTVLESLSGSQEEIFSACAASMTMRKSLFKNVGQFDPKFFAYYEDIDLSWRVRLNGYAVVVDLTSIVYHMRSATSSKFSRRHFDFHVYKNQIAMLFKNYDCPSFIEVVPGLFLLYSLRVLNGLIRNNVYLTTAALRALFWNLKELPYLWQQRIYTQKYVRRVNDKQIKKLMKGNPIDIFQRK